MSAENYPNLMREMQVIGEIVESRVKRQMKVDKFVASGKTLSSIKSEVYSRGDLISMGLSSRSAYGSTDEVLSLLDRGFKPKPVPNPSFILAWMKEKNIQPKGRGRRFVKATNSNMKKAAWAISKSIGQLGAIARFGYKGSNILEFALGPIEQKITEDILSAFGDDIDTMINEMKPR